MAAVRLAARGGARYAASAPRLFASAGEHREALRNDLALQTAEDVAATLGTMKGVLMKLGPDGQLRRRRPVPRRPADAAPAAGQRAADEPGAGRAGRHARSWASRRSGSSPPGTRSRSRRLRLARSTVH